jgi:hypothetical protein
MDNSQTPSDYKTYFFDKFVNLFNSIINVSLEKVNNNDVKKDLEKIASIVSKLDFEKVIKKVAANSKLQENLMYLSNNNFSNEVLNKLLEKNEKCWSLMPALNIDKIFLSLSINDRQELYKDLNALHISAFTYTKVIESINSINTSNTSDVFNPFESVGNVVDNMDIKTLYEGVEVKNLSAYEMLMETIINQQMNDKMSNYMDNIQEDDVNSAAHKLNDVLHSEDFKGTKQTGNILSEMLDSIKHEVIDMKNKPQEQTSGKKGVEQLLGIAQKVAKDMMHTIKDKNVNVLDLWDATSNLAQSTTNSDALKYVDLLIRSNIEKGLNQQQNPNAMETETPDESKNNKKKDKKNKKNI